MNFFKIAGIVFAAAVIAAVAMNFSDLRRYVKIEMM